MDCVFELAELSWEDHVTQVVVGVGAAANVGRSSEYASLLLVEADAVTVSALSTTINACTLSRGVTGMPGQCVSRSWIGQDLLSRCFLRCASPYHAHPLRPVVCGAAPISGEPKTQPLDFLLRYCHGDVVQ